MPQDAGKFLRDVVLPGLATDLANPATSPKHGVALTSLMHQRGVNIRYLGEL